MTYKRISKSSLTITRIKNGELVMSERINISIPDELYERMSHFRENLNLSKVCQKAISHAVRIEEIKENAMPNKKNLAARLKEESLKYGQAFIEKGFECGVKDSYRLSLDTFCEIQYFREAEHVGQIDGDTATYKDMFSFASEETEKILERLENDEFGDENWGLTTMLQPKRFFINGWLMGVAHIWDEVRNEVFEMENPDPNIMDPNIWGLDKSDKNS